MSILLAQEGEVKRAWLVDHAVSPGHFVLDTLIQNVFSSV